MFIDIDIILLCVILVAIVVIVLLLCGTKSIFKNKTFWLIVVFALSWILNFVILSFIYKLILLCILG